MKPKTQTSKIGKSGAKASVWGGLLVFETTGFELRATVARRGVKGALNCSVVAISHEPDFADAVGEVLSQLREQGHKRLPKKAVLVTPSAVGDLVYLPVDPNAPRKQSEMREMVRWEFLDVFEGQGDIWSLGAMLQGRGYVTAQQRSELESTAVRSGEYGSVADAYRDIVPKEALEECLQVQEFLIGSEGELMTGWSPLSGVDDDERFAWYCVGIGDDLRSQWVRALKKHGLYCTWIYPQLGSGFTSVDTKTASALYLDVQQEQYGLFHNAKGKLVKLSVHDCAYGTADPRQVAASTAEFAHADTSEVFLSAPAEQSQALHAALGEYLPGVEIKSLPAERVTLAGVARHALKLCASNRSARIQAQPPKQAIWKRHEFWVWAIIAALLIGIAAFDVSMRVRADRVELELELSDIEFERRMQVISQAEALNAEAREKQSNLVAMEQELEKKKRLLRILDEVIPDCQKRVPGVLIAVGQAIPEEVVLDFLQQNPDRSGLSLKGWAYRDTAGQRFADRLNETLAPWHYRVEDTDVSQGPSRTGVDGFVFEITMTQVESTEGGRDD